MGNSFSTESKESGKVKFFEEIQVNLRKKWELSPADRDREINSVKGSASWMEVGANTKSNFSIIANVRDDKEFNKKTLGIYSRHRRKVFEI